MHSADTLNSEHPLNKSGFLSIATPLAMLAAVTILAFANAWPDKLVLDDKAFAGPARPQELDSLKYIFTHDVWAATGRTGGLYRPFLLLDLSLENRVFGDWLAGYHLSNIFLHLLVTFLLYGFLRFVLRLTGNQSSAPDVYALLAAMVFAVHPIHTEVVNSVFNRSEMIVALFGLAGLWWLLRQLDQHPRRAWLGFGAVFFLSLLSKESAVALPALAIILILLLTPGDLISRVRRCLPVFWLLLPLTLYLVMRAYALAPPELRSTDQIDESAAYATSFEPENIGPAAGGAKLSATFDMMEFPGSRTVLKVAGVLGGSMKIIAWPYPLHLFNDEPSTLMSVVYLVLHVLLVIVSLVQLRRKRYGLAAGLGFFYIAMLPASRIVGDGGLGPHIAERYVYFPSVGLAILLAFAFRALTHRFGPRILLGFVAPILLVMIALTLDRNADWVNDVSLLGTEYESGARNISTLRLTTSAYLKAGFPERVVEICDENVAAQDQFGDSTFVQHCATAYGSQHRDEEEERAYLFAIQHETTRVAASMALARFYLRHDRREDAAQHFIAAIGWSEEPAAMALYRAEMIMGLNPNSRGHWTEARDSIEEALRLRPGWPEATKMLQAVEKALNSAPNLKIDEKGSGA